MTNELFQLEQIERLAQPNVEKTEEKKRAGKFVRYGELRTRARNQINGRYENGDLNAKAFS